jgi:hypothetical protein
VDASDRGFKQRWSILKDAMVESQTAGTFDFVYEGLIEERQQASTQEALQAAVGEISNPISRDILPDIDLDPVGDTVFTGTESEFIQTPTAEPSTDGTATTVYEIDSDTGKQDDRVLAIYGFEVVSGGSNVEVIRFRGSDGQVFERAHVQGLEETGDRPVDRQAVLRSPVLFRPQDNGEIEFELTGPSFTSGEPDEEVQIKLLGVSIEKRGRRIGNRS